MTDLSRVIVWTKLKSQREPYWHQLAVGEYLGFRPAVTGQSGHWHARRYDSATRKQARRPLGDFGHLPPNERFTAASAEAREWFRFVRSGGTYEVVTVKQACERYAETRPDAAKRFIRYVYDDPIANVKLHKLTPKLVLDWRRRLEDMPALVTRSKSGSQQTRKRAIATVNRDMVPFRAALNSVLDDSGKLTSRPWKKALEPVETNARRELYLDKDQRRLLLRHLPLAALPFVTALCLLPLRPGALAKALVGDFDVRQSTLFIRSDKADSNRYIPLSADAAKLLKETSRMRLPTAPLFTRDGIKPWNKDAWKVPIRKAVVAAGLPAGATAYSLRHSTITDLVQKGLPLLTIAQISGTSADMIETYYGHLQQEHAVLALSSLTL